MLASLELFYTKVTQDLHLTCIKMGKSWVCIKMTKIISALYEPRCEKTGFLNMRKQRRRSP